MQLDSIQPENRIHSTKTDQLFRKENETPGQMCLNMLNLESKEWILLSDWLTQITVLNIERENQETAIKGKLTMSEDSDKITTQNRKRL